MKDIQNDIAAAQQSIFDYTPHKRGSGGDGDTSMSIHFSNEKDQSAQKMNKLGKRSALPLGP